VGLEGSPLSLVSTTEEVLGRKNSRRDPSRWPRGTLYQQRLTLTSQTSSGCSAGIVRSSGHGVDIFFCFLSFAEFMDTWPLIGMLCGLHQSQLLAIPSFCRAGRLRDRKNRVNVVHCSRECFSPGSHNIPVGCSPLKKLRKSSQRFQSFVCHIS
jgi:hypothetical protein